MQQDCSLDIGLHRCHACRVADLHLRTFRLNGQLITDQRPIVLGQSHVIDHHRGDPDDRGLQDEGLDARAFVDKV